MKKYLLLVLFLALPSTILANDTFVYDNGHAVYPINTDKIRMVSEKITVQIKDDSASVHCSFNFENITNNEVEAKLGFPAEVDFFEPPMEPEPPLNEFKSSIEGSPVNVEIKGNEKGDYWYTWDVVFPPKKRINLENSYEVEFSLNYWLRWFKYVLKTGANWKDPIEKSIIEVSYKNSSEMRKRLIAAFPKNYRIKKNKLIWEFTNFIPTEDILIYHKNWDGQYQEAEKALDEVFSKYLSKKHYEGNSRSYSEKDYDIQNNKELIIEVNEITKKYGKLKEVFDIEARRLYTNFLRNEIFARHGREFESLQLRQMFRGQDWYKVNTAYSDDLLSKIEVENVKRILEYERENGLR